MHTHARAHEKGVGDVLSGRDLSMFHGKCPPVWPPELFIGKNSLSGPATSPNPKPSTFRLPGTALTIQLTLWLVSFPFLYSSCTSFFCPLKKSAAGILYLTVHSAHLSSDSPLQTWKNLLAYHCITPVSLKNDRHGDFLESEATVNITVLGEIHFTIYLMGFGTIQKL